MVRGWAYRQKITRFKDSASKYRLNTFIMTKTGHDEWQVTHPIDLMKSIHIELTDKGRKLRIYSALRSEMDIQEG